MANKSYPIEKLIADLDDGNNALRSADYGMTNSGIWIPKRVDNNGAQYTTPSKSKEGLSTEEKPSGESGDTYLEYDPETEEVKIYKYISGDWRVI